ncbi:hypothetical protein LXL04_009728 [Taraxacum kok-saghyz]
MSNNEHVEVRPWPWIQHRDSDHRSYNTIKNSELTNYGKSKVVEATATKRGVSTATQTPNKDAIVIEHRANGSSNEANGVEPFEVILSRYRSTGFRIDRDIQKPKADDVASNPRIAKCKLKLQPHRDRRSKIHGSDGKRRTMEVRTETEDRKAERTMEVWKQKEKRHLPPSTDDHVYIVDSAWPRGRQQGDGPGPTSEGTLYFIGNILIMHKVQDKTDQSRWDPPFFFLARRYSFGEAALALELGEGGGLSTNVRPNKNLASYCLLLTTNRKDQSFKLRSGVADKPSPPSMCQKLPYQNRSASSSSMYIGIPI